MKHSISLLFAACLALTPALDAQWLNYPSAGMPRTPDGKPNLSAPAPRSANGTPDLSGLWRAADRLPCNGVTLICGDLPISPQFMNIGAGLKDPLPYQQWALDRIKNKGVIDDPYGNCVTPGGPRMHLLPTMKKIIQTPALLVILDEYNASYRQIFTDARPLPDDPQPAYNGYSSGKWEGDTLVVHSIGYRDDQWMDGAGSPLTNAAKVTEKFHRPNYGTLEIEITVDDMKGYTKPWTVHVKQDLAPDTELLDANCLENEKDVEHMKQYK